MSGLRCSTCWARCCPRADTPSVLAAAQPAWRAQFRSGLRLGDLLILDGSVFLATCWAAMSPIASWRRGALWQRRSDVLRRAHRDGLRCDFVIALLLLLTRHRPAQGQYLGAGRRALIPAHEGDRRSRGFVIFSTGIKSAPSSAPSCAGIGTGAGLGDYGFGAAATLMLVALVTCLSGLSSTAPDPPRTDPGARPLTRAELRRCLALIAAGLLTVPFTASYMQIGNS